MPSVARQSDKYQNLKCYYVDLHVLGNSPVIVCVRPCVLEYISEDGFSSGYDRQGQEG